MIETYWDKFITMDCGTREDPCGHCGACRVVEYNVRHFGLSPLDRPGSEEYFQAVMASFRREAEARGRLRPNGNGHGKVSVRVERGEPGKLSPQRCYKCARLIRGEKCYAAVNLPLVLCLECFASCRGNATVDSKTIRFEVVKVSR